MDGAPAEAKQLSELDPFYIEVCRRIRFQLNSDGNLYAIRASSRAARVDSKALNGMAGGPLDAGRYEGQQGFDPGGRGVHL